MEKFIKKSVVKQLCHKSQFRISNDTLSTLEKKLSLLVKEQMEQIMRSARIGGRKNIRREDWGRER